VAAALQALGVPPQADLPFTPAEASPWQDALLLRDVAPALAGAAEPAEEAA
jgi:hypothetical protein